MQYWTPNNPCGTCDAMSNTSHESWCADYNKYDAEGQKVSEGANHNEEEALTMDTTTFKRKDFFVEAVRVTEENMVWIADWCGGKLRTKKSTETRFIKVNVKRPANPRQTEAYVGDWVLEAGTGFKVFKDDAFKNNFDSIDGVPDSDEETPTPPTSVEVAPDPALDAAPVEVAPVTSDAKDPFTVQGIGDTL